MSVMFANAPLPKGFPASTSPPQQASVKTNFLLKILNVFFPAKPAPKPLSTLKFGRPMKKASTEDLDHFIRELAKNPILEMKVRDIIDYIFSQMRAKSNGGLLIVRPETCTPPSIRETMDKLSGEDFGFAFDFLSAAASGLTEEYEGLVKKMEHREWVIRRLPTFRIFTPSHKCQVVISSF